MCVRCRSWNLLAPPPVTFDSTPGPLDSSPPGSFFGFFPYSSRLHKWFNGQNLSKKLSFSRVKLLNFFTGTDFFSRVEFDENPHGHDFAFTGTFLAKTSFFSREFFFFTGKKKPCYHSLTRLKRLFFSLLGKKGFFTQSLDFGRK